MKLLYITQHFATLDSAASSRHWWATHQLKEAGWDVTVVTGLGYLPKDLKPDWLWSRIKIDGINLIILNISYSQKTGFWGRGLSFFIYMFAATLVSLFIRPRPDIVFASSTPLTVAVPTLISYCLRRVPFVFEVRDLWPDGPVELGKIKNRCLQFILYKLEFLTYKCAASIIALSPGMQEGIIKKGVPHSKIFVIPNSSDIQFFSSGADGESFKIKYNLSGKFICAHTGTMGFVNGVDAILDAAAFLKDSHPYIAFILVGDGNERTRLEERVRREQIKNVSFINPLPKKEMPACLAATDLGLMTIRYFKNTEQNCANKFFDYLASATPVLLNYGGWHAEWILKYTAGVCVPPNNPEAFAKAIVDLASDPRRLKEMGYNAHHLAKDQFERHRHMHRLESVIRHAVIQEDMRSNSIEPWPFK